MNKWTIVCGGPAGLGPNFISNLIAKGLVEAGYFVFNSREYESRVRGGHNYNILTFSAEPVYSNTDKWDILIALDELSKQVHAKDANKTNKSGIVVTSNHNSQAVGMVFKILGLKFSDLDKLFHQHGNYEENVKEGRIGYEQETRSLNLKHPASKHKEHKDIHLLCANEAIAQGAVAAGLDYYYAYPMTPATGVLFELAGAEAKNGNKYVTVEMDSELTVVNAALGSAITGANVMAGTSGGGFDLMTESLTLAGIGEIPLTFYLCQRPGPATGAATYTAQGDLNIARHAGHGEFPRIVGAPGDPVDAAIITTQLMYLAQKYRVPTILLNDKHLADSFYSVSGQLPAKELMKAKATFSWPARFTSYEADENRIASSNPQLIVKNVNKRLATIKAIQTEIDKMTPFLTFGKPTSKNIVIGWGSTQGAIRDAIKGMDCKFVQPRFLEPMSQKFLNSLKSAKKIVIVESNATGQLANLIAEKSGIVIPDKNRILRYDGRPFLAQPLAKEIARRFA